MDDSSSKSILTKLGIAVLVIALIDLFYLNYWVLKSGQLKMGNATLNNTREVRVDTSPSPTIEPVSSPSPITAASSTSQIVNTTTVVQTAQKEIFIPLGSGLTKSGSFTTLSGLQVSIDTTKYSAIESVVFEASIWVDGGNGRAWAKLINIGDNNPLIESQISSPSGTAEVKTSGNVPIPAGAKTYGVQAKTDLTDFAAHVDNARIKIVLK